MPESRGKTEQNVVIHSSKQGVGKLFEFLTVQLQLNSLAIFKGFIF